MVERSTIYFESPGPQNTLETLKAALKRAEELKIRNVVVASTTGETGVLAAKTFKGYNLVVVSHHVGFREPGKWEFRRECKEEILKLGGKVLTATHTLSGVERSIRRKFNTIGPVELIAHTYRTFCEGVKVCVEIAVMAADAGLIPVDEEVIAIGGTGRGADTALILKPAHSNNFFNLEVREVICKPRSRSVEK